MPGDILQPNQGSRESTVTKAASLVVATLLCACGVPKDAPADSGTLPASDSGAPVFSLSYTYATAADTHACTQSVPWTCDLEGMPVKALPAAGDFRAAGCAAAEGPDSLSVACPFYCQSEFILCDNDAGTTLSTHCPVPPGTVEHYCGWVP